MQIFQVQRILLFLFAIVGYQLTSKGQTVPIQSTHRILWLRADAGVLNASGNPAGDGERVATWLDQSGDATLHHFTQSVNNLRPTFIRNANGAPAIRFNAASNTALINNTDPFSSLYPRTIFIVFRIGTPSNQGYSFFSLYSNNSTHSEVFATSNGTYRPLSLAIGFPASTGNCIGVNPGGFHNNVDVFTITYNGMSAAGAGVGNNYQFYNRTDNPLTGSTSGAYGRIATDKTSSIGGRASQGILYMTGDIYEILVYDEVLSDIERNRVITNLQGRYPVIFPLTLLNFSALYVNKEVQLEWNVTDEINISRYYTEFSKDGKSWTSFDSIMYQNGTSGLKHYKVIHKSPFPGKNFYRIKWVELNGKTSYSPIQSLYIGSDPNLYVLPTLANDHITLQTGMVGLFELNIINAAGSIVLHKLAVQNNDFIKLGSLPAGMYQAVFKADNGSEKVVKFFKR
ncbi:MAG TPA: T9SS type A sorting domain-containing protein [Flavisolibacter sp.]|jgi:hypothetical protein|nr:T9SS type A sorting domain-containing protein [Flavisolibacter sp.]